MQFRIRMVLALCLTAIVAAACASNGDIVTRSDPFAGPSKTFIRYLDPGHFTAVGMGVGGGKYNIQVLIAAQGQHGTVGQKGAEGLFKLGSETLSLPAAAEAKPVHSVQSSATQYAAHASVATQWIVVFLMTPEQFRKFGEAPLSAVQVTIGEVNPQLVLRADDSAMIMKNAKIMAQ